MEKVFPTAFLIFYSTNLLADGGCHSPYTIGCLLWFSILILGICLFFWAIFLPIFFILKFFLRLSLKLQILFLILSFISVFCSVYFFFSEQNKYVWYSTPLEKYQSGAIWIIIPIFYILIYLALYFFQVMRNRNL
jgi:hypothetical protein